MERKFLISEGDRYLAIPIQIKNEKKVMRIEVDEEILTEVNIPQGNKLEEYVINYWAYIPVYMYRNKMITIKGDFHIQFLDMIHLVSEIEYPKIERPQIHFTPSYGWINDPNGLVCHNGTYHLYYQYNPFDTAWDNMSWGHAVSHDLIHWKDKELVMLPDQDGMIFSGCGIVNRQAALDLPEESLLFFYSAAGDSNGISKGKNFVQKIAYSLDQGEHLVKTNRGMIPTIEKENRDPKVFWHEESKAYIMCIWLQNMEFAILRSDDLENWQISHRFELEDGFECPDLFELMVDEMEKKWVFWSADGYYYLGDFDGYLFISERTKREAYQTKIPYAAQTISNLEERVVSIPWFRTKEKKDIYCGSMGLARELSLTKRKGDFFLRHTLAREVMEKRKLECTIESAKDICHEFTLEKQDMLAWMVESKLKSSSDAVKWELFGHNITFDFEIGKLKVNKEELYIGEKVEDFVFIYDKGILEITADNDIIYAVFDLEDDDKKNCIKIWTKTFEYVNIYRIK